MIKAELKYLRKHSFQLIVLFVIALIPSIYAVTFLKSMWNPYGETDHLKIAVVDHDKRAAMNGKHLTLGSNLTSTLEKSNTFDFRHVRAQTAARGLKNGKYFAIYTIPQSFSKDATTVFTNHPHQLTLHVKLSAGHNLTASKMAGTGSTAIQSKLNGQLSKAYTQTLVTGFNKVARGMKQANNGASKLAKGSKTVNAGVRQFQGGLRTATNGQQTLATSATKLVNGTQQYTSGVDSAANGSQVLVNGLARVNAGIPALGSGMGKMATGTNALSTGLDQANAGSVSLAQGAAKLNQGVATFTNSSATLADKSKAFSDSLQAFATQVNHSEQSGSTNLSQLATLIKATQSTLNQLTAAESQTATSASNNVGAVAANMHLSATQTDALKNAVSQTYAASATKQQSALNPLLSQLQAALSGLQSSATAQGQSAATMSGALNQLTSGANQLANGDASLANAATSIGVGTTTVANGAQSLSTATAKLANGADTLNQSLTASLPQVNALVAGTQQLASGSKQLNGGLTTLATNGSTLNGGTQALAAGATKLAGGGQQLTAAAHRLQTGTSSVAKGNNQLHAKLANGTMQLPKLHYTQSTAKMVNSPVKLATHDHSKVPNNGTAMMPYMGGVALYVCALAINLMYDTATPRKRPKHVYDVWASKSVVVYSAAIIAATIEYLSLIGIAGLRPTNGFATWLMLVTAGITMMSVVTWLNVVFNKLGSFLAMILLVFQLGSAGGTYPIELSNGFFQALHPFLPLSYVVDGLRHTVMMYSWPANDFLILFGFFLVFTMLTLVNYARKTLRMSASDMTALDNQ